jgi:hypothetical protein
MTTLARLVMFALLASTVVLGCRVMEQNDLLRRAEASMADLSAADARLKAATDELFQADQHLQMSCLALRQAMGVRP